MIKLKDGSMIPSAFVSAPGSGVTNGLTADKSIKQRYNFMQELKNQQFKKKSQNLTFEQLKSTF